jgi:hypothetical protein
VLTIKNKNMQTKTIEKKPKATQSVVTMNNLTDVCWQFAATVLWPSTHFSTNEIAEAKNSISIYITLSRDSVKAYSIFCQRVLLAKEYVSYNSVRYLPLPSVWLNPQNAKGFAGTRAWYKQMEETRASLPFYKIELKALAEAVWDMTFDPTERNFRFWKDYFIQRNATQMLNYFLNTVANLQFSNT